VERLGCEGLIRLAADTSKIKKFEGVDGQKRHSKMRPLRSGCRLQNWFEGSWFGCRRHLEMKIEGVDEINEAA